jgi:hypothetical protein
MYARVSETLVIWEENLFPSSLSSEYLKGLTGNVGTRGLQSVGKNCCVAAKKRAGKVGLLRLLRGTVTVAKLDYLEAVSQETCRNTIYLGAKEQ